MKLNMNLGKGVWHDLEGSEPLISFLIRPFPIAHAVITNLQENNQIETFWRVFDFSLIDFKNVTGLDDKPLECTSEVKRILFDFSRDAMMLVIAKATENNVIDIKKKIT